MRQEAFSLKQITLTSKKRQGRPIIMVHRTPYERARRTVYHMLGGEGHRDWRVKLVDGALILLITLNVFFSILESVEHLAIVHGPVFHAFDVASVLIFTVEYILRIWTAVEHETPEFRHPVYGRLRFALTPLALVDLLAIMPFYLGMLVTIDLRAMRVLRLLRIFKLTRYSTAMTVLAAVVRQESKAIGAVLFITCVALIATSSLMYLFEHYAQPEKFSDIPSVMWWSIVTLATLGYGDMVPITPPGKLLGGVTALIGVGLVALQSGVLASGFSEQLRLRREHFRDQVEEALHDGQLTRKAKRSLTEARIRLQLTEEEAVDILERAMREQPAPCPHCGNLIPPPHNRKND
jgi:voltage-gated potassium channel